MLCWKNQSIMQGPMKVGYVNNFPCIDCEIQCQQLVYAPEQHVNVVGVRVEQRNICYQINAVGNVGLDKCVIIYISHSSLDPNKCSRWFLKLTYWLKVSIVIL